MFIVIDDNMCCFSCFPSNSSGEKEERNQECQHSNCIPIKHLLLCITQKGNIRKNSYYNSTKCLLELLPRTAGEKKVLTLAMYHIAVTVFFMFGGA